MSSPTLPAFAAALLDASAPAPAGLCAWNGSDPAVRFAVYRNNVVHSLVAVLGDTYPVVRELVGDEFFGAMARRFVVDHPPASPLMHRYGAAFPQWIADFEPATALPYLSDLARLEFARLAAIHAADAEPLDADMLARLLQDPVRLAHTSLILDPSFTPLHSPHPVVSLWSAHQLDATTRDARLAVVDLDVGESALVFRVDDDTIVLEAPHSDVALASALAAGHPLGEAQAAHPQARLAQLLAMLLEHGLVVGLRTPRA